MRNTLRIFRQSFDFYVFWKRLVLPTLNFSRNLFFKVCTLYYRPTSNTLKFQEMEELTFFWMILFGQMWSDGKKFRWPLRFSEVFLHVAWSKNFKFQSFHVLYKNKTFYPMSCNVDFFFMKRWSLNFLQGIWSFKHLWKNCHCHLNDVWLRSNWLDLVWINVVIVHYTLQHAWHYITTDVN